MNGGTGANDTHPDAERVQIDLVRAAGPARQISLALALSDMTRRLALDAIRQANPEATDQEVRLIFADVHYGSEIADRLRAHLHNRAQ